MVDPLRHRRITTWLKNLGGPASDRPHHRVLWWGVVLFAAATLTAAFLLWGLSDLWWPATTLLFGPRWVLALPLALLIPAAMLWDRALLVPLALLAALLAGPIIEMRTGWRGLLAQPDPVTDLRVVTYNVEGGSRLATTAAGMAQRWEADILLFQECGGILRDEIQELIREPPGPPDASAPPLWYGDSRASLCVLSRLPIHEVEEMERTALRAAGGSGLVATYRIGLADTPIQVTNVHLETPRDGFELLRSGQILSSIPLIAEKSYMRTIELAQARRWVDQAAGTPRIVGGDFNTPRESRAYRNAWSDWTNAFTEVGRGYGGTRLNGWIRPRIDHILVDRSWQVIDAWVGEDLGSDHLPVIATVRLREGRR